MVLRVATGAALLVTVLVGCSNATAGNPVAAPGAPAGSSTTTTTTSAPAPASTTPKSPHFLVINLTGNGTLSTLTYVVAGKSTTESGVAVPWRKSLELPAGMGEQQWSLHGELGHGSVQSEVTLDGQVVTQGSISGGGEFDLSGSVDN
jgi:hypothetical protein